MKKIVVRLSSLALTLVFVMALMAPAMAASNPRVQPRWAALNTLECVLTPKSSLFSNARASATVSTASSNCRLSLTLTIQVMSGGQFVDTDKSWSSSGQGATNVGKDVKLGAGNYRSKAVVTVYSASGAYIETVTGYSADILI